MVQQNWLDAVRLTVVVGHFGSGKSEFALNLAVALAREGHPFALADLDIVDPYFRSRECRQMLEQCGGRLIASSQACLDADVPSIPAEVSTLFDDKNLYGVLDVGGDPSGTRVLARYRHKLAENDTRVLLVVNGNRPLTDKPERAGWYLREIERVSGLRIDGLVNNTHLCGQTRVQDILSGASLIRQLSDETGIPVVCHTAPQELAEEAGEFLCPVFPMQLFLKKPWEC